ncbi:NAD-dependent epimerase/dehydratase family protein [Frankia tisae]|uniref:NAD-dependent epimerase/dehydratase family protein n=1 Tax=Frankia tisae TaxID=2950104 RepID=UPI0021BE6E93|nr:NAD-dependent epimerase/dehydratase family protein [Frankia tisae]
MTGDRGLVGAAVTATLAAVGHETVGFDLVDGHDVRDPQALGHAAMGCEGIVHLAAVDEPVDDPGLAEFGPTTTGTDAAVFETNVLGMHNVLWAAERHQVTRVVTISSVDVPRKILPEVPGRGDTRYESDPFLALLDTRPARTLLGWAPRHRWRDAPHH